MLKGHGLKGHGLNSHRRSNARVSHSPLEDVNFIQRNKTQFFIERLPGFTGVQLDKGNLVLACPRQHMFHQRLPQSLFLKLLMDSHQPNVGIICVRDCGNHAGGNAALCGNKNPIGLQLNEKTKFINPTPRPLKCRTQNRVGSFKIAFAQCANRNCHGWRLSLQQPAYFKCLSKNAITLFIFSSLSNNGSA